MPTLNVVAVELVIAGAWFTVRVKACVASGDVPLAAESRRGNVPVLVGVPEIVAVPLPPSTNVMPEGNAPLSEMTGVGEPEVVIRIGAIAELTAEDAEDPLVNDGAMAGEATPRAFRSDGAPKAIAPRRALENVRAIATALSSVGSSETPALIVPTSRRTRTRGTIVADGDGITSEEPKPSTCGRMVKDRWARASVVLGVEREASHPPQEERANNTAPRPESPIPRNNALRSSTRELPSAARCILRTIVPIKAADGAVVDTLLSRKTSGGVTSFGGRRGSSRFGAGGFPDQPNRTHCTVDFRQLLQVQCRCGDLSEVCESIR